MTTTQNITTETFVIDKPRPEQKLLEVQKQPPFKCLISAVRFQLGSAELSDQSAEKLIASLGKCSVSRKTPLTITGHTCQLGTEKYNQSLSLQRAETVATYLRAKGFSVAVIQGNGSHNPISNNRENYFKNRRVEIDL